MFVEQEPSSVDALSRCADQTNETKPPCYYYAQFTPPVRHDKTVLSVSCQAVSIESARPPDKCVLRRSASGGRTGSACAARHTPTLNALVGWSGRLSSHRHTRHDKTVLSVSCLVCRCELEDCSERVQTSNFLSASATVLSCRESHSHRRSGGDTDKTVLSYLAWRCELALISFNTQ